MVRLLHGGSSGRTYEFGPQQNEVVVVIQEGSPPHFTKWTIGSVQEVIAHLQEAAKEERGVCIRIGVSQ